MPIFLDLSEDVLLAIYAHLDPADILSLIQTCRVLHAFGHSDYVWHQMNVDLPLDLPAHTSIKALSSAQLHRIVVKALRLERNWSRRVSHIRRMTLLVQGGDVIHQIQPLASRHLVTLSRSPFSASVSIWCLEGTKAPRIASLDVGHSALKFAASLHSGSTVYLAIVEYYNIGQGAEHLRVYALDLNSDSPTPSGDHPRPMELRLSLSKSKHRGTFFDVQISGHVVAAGIAHFQHALGTPPEYELIIIDMRSKAEWNLKIEHSSISCMRFKLCDDCIFVIGITQDGVLSIRQYSFSRSSSAPRLGSTPIIDDELLNSGLCPEANASSLTQFWSSEQHFSLDCDIIVPDESDTAVISNYLPILVLSPPFSPASKWNGCMVHVPIKSSNDGTSIHVDNFTLFPRISTHMVCVGATGRRAIWLQRRWDIDEYTMMKASFSYSDKAPVVEALLPSHLALPFLPHSCQSLGFDEALGRVFISLHTGELYMLEL